jgi:hypothetical protein
VEISGGTAESGDADDDSFAIFIGTSGRAEVTNMAVTSGAAGYRTAGISVSSSPTVLIADNVIHAGVVSNPGYQRMSAGVHFNSGAGDAQAEAIVRNNVITFEAGAASQERYGVYADVVTYANAQIDGNTITMPDGTDGNFDGIYWWPNEGDPGANLITNNSILREAGTNGSFIGVRVRISDRRTAPVLVANNSIVSLYAGDDESSYFQGVRVYKNEDVRIENNLIVSGTELGSNGVYYYMDNSYDGPATLRNNYIDEDSTRPRTVSPQMLTEPRAPRRGP